MDNTFPTFNIHSTVLLILMIQGIILACLLLSRYSKHRNPTDLILSFLVLITCYHRTTYTIGFMSWYDTFRNTKINYYLISLGLAVGPLIYYYIKSSVAKRFSLKRKHLIHLIPAAIYILFKISTYAYDSMQAGFDDTQNGIISIWAMEHLSIPLTAFFMLHMLVYLIASFKLYYTYKKRLKEEQSNLYAFELRWLRNFLYAFAFLFLYDAIQNVTDGFIFDLHWTQEWWYQLFSVVIILYIGIKGYFDPVDHIEKIELYHADKNATFPASSSTFEFQDDLFRIKELISSEQLFLNPNLSLNQLSRKAKINTTQLSYIINKGEGVNFNDFINRYRVEEVKKLLSDPEKENLSILALAFDSGFSSKPTFNRVFKKMTGISPTQFRK